MQQPYQQQLQPLAAPTAAAAAAAGISAFAGGAPAQPADIQGQLPRATSLNAYSIDMPSSQQDAAAAAAGAGTSSFALPSPSVVTGGAFSYGQPPGSQLQLQTTGSDFAVYAAGAPSAGGAATASGYTAGGKGGGCRDELLQWHTTGLIVGPLLLVTLSGCRKSESSKAHGWTHSRRGLSGCRAADSKHRAMRPQVSRAACSSAQQASSIGQWVG
jgi:hypothetical protein